MKIRVTVIKREVEEVEVAFPIFREHYSDLGEGRSISTFTRIDANHGGAFPPFMSKSLTIHRDYSSDDGPRYEFESDLFTFNEGEHIDYALGRGPYVCTEEQFNEVVAEAFAALAMFLPAKPDLIAEELDEMRVRLGLEEPVE